MAAPTTLTPRGPLRHASHLLRPSALPALSVALERDARLRARRLTAAAADAMRERRHPTRERMRALQARPGGELRWRTVPVPPPPGPAGALVRPLAVATCDLDRMILLGASPFALPLCVGHECVAEVLSVGSDVATVAVGQRVVVPFQISCGTCPSCAADHPGNCAAVPPISMYGFGVAGGHWGGAVADVLAVPFADGMLVALPDGIDPAAAASVADNVADGYRHIGPFLPSLLARDPDARVLIVAAMARHLVTPSVPLYAGLTALALGARDVTLADARPEVRRMADSLGLRAVTPADAARMAAAPLVVDASASAAGLRLALDRTAPDGTCSSIGGLYKHVKLPLSVMYGRNASLHVSRTHARAFIPAILELMVSGKLAPELVTTLTAPMDDAPAALGEHMRGASVKTVLTA